MPWTSLTTFNAESFAPIARGHEFALQLVTEPKVITALGDLAVNPGLRDTVAENPMAFIAERKISLPSGSIVTLRKYQQVWEIEVTVEEGEYTFTNGFNSSKGFYHR